ncbi:MAG: hypothetical protein MUO82_02410 [Candidatus Thermoplasmatota archaeon]|nr:hypothetical protein [Candidatus Thermoplasmatota archaeon]
MNKKETEKMHYVKVIREKQPVRPSELGFKRVRYEYIAELEGAAKICQKKWGRGYTLLFMPGMEHLAIERYEKDILKNKRTFDKQHLEQQSILPILKINEIDEAISKIIDTKGKIPVIEEIAIYMEKDPQNPVIHSQIFERLAIVKKKKQPIEEEIKSLFYAKVKAFGKTRKYEEEECIPKYEEILDRLSLVESERNNPAIQSLIRLCIKDFKNKQIVLF